MVTPLTDEEKDALMEAFDEGYKPMDIIDNPGFPEFSHVAAGQIYQLRGLWSLQQRGFSSHAEYHKWLKRQREAKKVKTADKKVTADKKEKKQYKKISHREQGQIRPKHVQNEEERNEISVRKKIENIRNYHDVATSEILQENKDECITALEKIYDYHSIDQFKDDFNDIANYQVPLARKILESYERLLTEVRHIVKRGGKGLARAYARKIPEFIQESWASTYGAARRMTDKVLDIQKRRGNKAAIKHINGSMAEDRKLNKKELQQEFYFYCGTVEGFDREYFDSVINEISFCKKCVLFDDNGKIFTRRYLDEFLKEKKFGELYEVLNSLKEQFYQQVS